MVTFAACAASGIYLDRWLEHQILGSESLFRLLSWMYLAALLTVYVSRIRYSNHCNLLFALLCLPTFATGHALESFRSAKSALRPLITTEQLPCIVTGFVVSEVGRRNSNKTSKQFTEFDLDVKQIQLGSRLRPMQGKIRVSVDGENQHIHTGCELKVAGRIRQYSHATNPGQIDRYLHYRRRGIDGFLRCSDSRNVEILRSNQHLGYWLWNVTQCYAEWGVSRYFHCLSESNARLASALVLGRRECLTEQTRNQFIVTGTAHVLSVSGLHLGLLITGVHFLLTILRISNRCQSILVIGVCVLYSLLTGLRPPVVRASLMMIICVIGTSMKRPSDTLNYLGLTAFVFLLFNYRLLFDLGAQLSFLAVATILVINKRWISTLHAQNRERSNSQIKRLRTKAKSPLFKLICLTLSPFHKSLQLSSVLFLVTTPFLWMHFHLISPISILANVLVGPLLLVTLIPTLILPGISLLHESFATFLGVPCDLLLGLLQRLIHFASQLEGGHFWLPGPSSTAVLVFYLALLFCLLLQRKKTHWVLKAFFIVGWYASTIIQPIFGSKDKPLLEVVFLDVGHGTCVIIRNNKNQTWVYDCGSLGRPAFVSQLVSRALWQMDISKLSGVFISHPDADHYNGIEGIMERFEVDAIFTTGTTLIHENTNLQRMLHKARHSGVCITKVKKGDRFDEIAEASTVLHPYHRFVGDTKNASSLVLEISLSKNRLILPGDLEGNGITALTANPIKVANCVVMAPHHGTYTPKTADFLQWCKPQWCVTSGGIRSVNKTMLDALQENNIATFSTHKDHAIRVSFLSDGTVDFKSWDNERWCDAVITGF